MVEASEEVDYQITCVDFKKVKCPYCGAYRVKQYGQSRDGKVKYYRCQVCVFPDPERSGQGDYTKFKAVEVT